MNEIEMNTTI